ncbi:hypothetical protein C8Q74DRAFT_836718 [Fomes fomentarius]|nr:hypothetical protein C8Q74DRAFT_836718 [Fomes fomentarius]
MSDAINVDSAVPPAQAVAHEEPRAEVPAAEVTVQADPEVLAVLAETQNECLAELGYRPTLLQEYVALQKTCAMLSADNQKLYADNRSLATFIQQQDQRVSLLQAPLDQQKVHVTKMHEQLRLLTQERDEMAGRLHHALNEVMMLRQELSRFVSDASSRGRMPSGSVPRPGPQVVGQNTQNTQQRTGSYPVVQPHGQPIVPHSENMTQHYGDPRKMPHIAPGRPVQTPQHRGSLPMLLPASASGQHITSISQHRRPSAPTPLTMPLAVRGPGQSPASGSPLNTFSGLSLVGSPANSRPGTANSSGQPYPRSASSSRPPSSRGLHVPPHAPSNPSSSSLAGAITDLTQDEGQDESARKRRKLEHTPHASAPLHQAIVPPQQAAPPLLQAYVPQHPAFAPSPQAAAPMASSVAPVSPAGTSVHAPQRHHIQAQQFTVPASQWSYPPQTPQSSSHAFISQSQHYTQMPHPITPQQLQSGPSPVPQAVSPQSSQYPRFAPVPQVAPPHQPQSAPMTQASAHVQPQSQPQGALSPHPHTQSQQAAVGAPVQYMQIHPAVHQAQQQYGTPPTPTSIAPTPQVNRQGAVSAPSQPQPPPSAPASTPVRTPSVTPDAVMSDVHAQVEQEQQTTVEQDCIEANFDPDDNDETKLWCKMCRSRYNRGHTTEVPTPFVGASEQQLIEHCETVHPRGWEILRSKVAEQQAGDAQG